MVDPHHGDEDNNLNDNEGVVVVEDIEVEEYEDIEELEDCDENVENSESDIENDEDGSARRTLYLDALRRWALDCNLPHLQLTKLLKIDKNFCHSTSPLLLRLCSKFQKYRKKLLRLILVIRFIWESKTACWRFLRVFVN